MSRSAAAGAAGAWPTRGAAGARAGRCSTCRRSLSALAGRPVIDEADGLIRSRTGASSQRARESLREMSQRDHVKMIDVAQHLVDEAVRRARARHVDG